jgi:hypothetical protein
VSVLNMLQLSRLLFHDAGTHIHPFLAPQKRVDRLETFDWGRLRLLDAKLVDETLSLEEAKAVVAHLRTNYSDAVSLLSDHQLFRLVSETSVTELPAAEQQLGTDVPKDLMYEKGVTTDICTLILSGKVTVLAGSDQFRSDVSSWTVLASSALTEVSYSPDFTAFVSGPCRCLRFTRDSYVAAVDASTLEKISHHEQSSADVSRHSMSDVTRIREPSHGNLPSGHPTTADVSPSDKLRATQARRNKLIAAFQRAKKPLKGGKEANGVHETKDSDGEAHEDHAENDARDTSVRFLSASDRDATTSQYPRPPSPREMHRPPSPKDTAVSPAESKTKARASTDGEISGSGQKKTSAFEFIGTGHDKQESDADNADDK